MQLFILPKCLQKSKVYRGVHVLKYLQQKFFYAYPIVLKSFAWLGFQNFCNDVGVPRELVMDGN
jgi:hypothetical protein